MEEVKQIFGKILNELSSVKNEVEHRAVSLNYDITERINQTSKNITDELNEFKIELDEKIIGIIGKITSLKRNFDYALIVFAAIFLLTVTFIAIKKIYMNRSLKYNPTRRAEKLRKIKKKLLKYENCENKNEEVKVYKNTCV